ncbi:hypothetical protein GCM10009850_051470 [Nonomuraea monospora]|uniref:Uncharacterized protein n=1 Tax=Nonomuraea monospora TaxID=568818 RepID=A0ABP5PGF0_9ACTN
MTITSDIRLGVVRSIQYGLIAEPDIFAPQAQSLGAGLIRTFFYWSQLEPEPGHYDWSAVDAVLDQADANTELWFTLGSSSTWGTTRATDLLPASPPHDPAAYARLVRALVKHCGGRVRYWQCENEPSNPLFWAGTAGEYVTHLAGFHQAVKATDPQALVVLGGCPPTAFAEPGAEQDFFLQLIRDGEHSYDIFDIHLYGDPYQIPSIVAEVRSLTDKPVIVGEYNGPLLVQYPEAFEHLGEVLAAGALTPWHTMTIEDFRTGLFTAEPVRQAMRRLYNRMPDLPPTLQMFMTGCPADLEAERHRLNADDIIVRNVIALSCGIRRTVCWQLGPDALRPADPYAWLNLLFSKFTLLDYDDQGLLTVRHPSADAFAELAAQLSGAKSVVRVEVPGRPDAHVYEFVGTGRHVGWVHGSEPLSWRGTDLGARPVFIAE